jgi:hypothetical protein
MKIYTPVKNATGTWCTVRFVNGVGETNDPHLIKWFKAHGYKVEEPTTTPTVGKVAETTEKEVGKVADEVVDLESMTPIELREWAKANGHGSKIKNIRNKEKLLEVIRG